MPPRGPKAPPRRGARRGPPAAAGPEATSAPARAEVPPRERARALALRALAAAPRTEAWLRARLARADLEAEADGVVAWLEGLGYLDDAAFARARARALAGSGKVGPRLAAQRLARAGVPPADARLAVDAAFAEEGDEAARCRALALRRLRGTDPRALDPAGLRRLARFLAGRGFSGSAVARALGVRVDVEVGEDG